MSKHSTKDAQSGAAGHLHLLNLHNVMLLEFEPLKH